METIAAKQSLVVYSDATYSYRCYASPGTALSSAEWAVKRITTATSREMWAQNQTDKSLDHNVATDLAAVQALTYI